MNRKRMMFATFIFLLVLPALFAQDVVTKDKEKDKEKGKETVVVKDVAVPDVAIKVQMLLTEFNGTQKISSLPYTLFTLASPPRRRDHGVHLRLGVKVPVGSNYEDVGTNIDCTAQKFENDAYYLELSIDRSSVSIRGPNGEEAEWKPGAEVPVPLPILRSFKDSFELVMHDGQSMEGTSAVDPVTGHVLKVEVTFNVLK
jgi:hypothetical protein